MSDLSHFQWIAGERAADEVIGRILDGSALPFDLGAAFNGLDSAAAQGGFWRRVQKALETRVSV